MMVVVHNTHINRDNGGDNGGAFSNCDNGGAYSNCDGDTYSNCDQP